MGLVMGTWNSTYDTLNRLAGAADAPPTGATTTLPNVSPNYCWSYDAFGNRTMQAGSSAAFSNSATCTADSSATLISAWATYNAKNQIIGTPQSPAGPVYDASGDVTDDGKNQYLYDAEGRICAVASTPVASMTTYTGYLYDADGTRVAKGTITKWSCDPSSNGFMTINDFVLGLGGEQVTEMGIDTTAGSSATTLAWQHTNVWAGGKLLGTYDKTGLHFYLDDPLGTRRAQTNYAGVLEQTCSSLPYGDALSCTGGGLAAPTEHHFTGKERDTESGNDYFMARYYSSAMGRFMSPDWSAKVEPVPYSKLEFPQTLNLYVYVLNNPLIHTDPDGHACGGSGQPPCGGNQPGEQLQAVKDLHAAISPPPEDFSRGDMAVEPSHASYSITTGQISLVDTDAGKSTVIGTGYSGKGDGLNNPSMENVPGSKASPVAGPLPEGKYTIGKQQDNVTGSGTKLAGSERLTPQGGSDMHGRGGFLIHGDNARQNNSASEGCIVTSRATRDAIGASGDRTLDVDR